MGQVFVAATTATSSAAVNSLAAAWPSTTAGDLVLCCLAIGGLSTLVDPTGFTASGAALDTSTTLRTKTWTHVNTGSESGSVTASWTGTAQEGSFALVAFRNVDTTTPVNITGTNGTATATTTPAVAAAAATNTKTDLQVVVLGSVNATAAVTATGPAGTTELADTCSTATPFIGLAVYQAQAVTAALTALPARTITLTQSSGYAAQQIGLAPLVSAETDAASGGAYVGDCFRFQGNPPTVGQLWPRGTQSTRG